MTNPILTHEFYGQKFYFNDTPTAPFLIKEIFSDNYKVLEKGIEFRPGDIILDIGACEGMFSIMMAKLFPQTRVIALEPVSGTYFQMIRNKGLNGCTNIEAYNVGIGKPGQHTITLNVSKGYSGGSSSLCTFDPINHYQIEVGLISLDEAFELYKIDRCRLLKMDIEGAEFDALYPSTVLPRVDYMTAEFHRNQRLDFLARRADALAVWCMNKTGLFHVELCSMAE
jgi:FkbM family methyltransferase